MKGANFFKKMRLESNSIVAIKAGTSLAKTLEIQNLAKACEGMNIENLVIVVVDDLSDIDAIGEKKMNELGWFNIESLRKMIDRKLSVSDLMEDKDASEDVPARVDVQE